MDYPFNYSRSELRGEHIMSEVHELSEDDQSAFVFTARLQALVAEFDGKISTASAIGAFEIVKHSLIADALEVSE